MKKQLVDIDGQEVMVREDVAKAYRGVNWMAIVMAIFILIIAVVAGSFLISASMDGEVESPTDIERR